MGVRVTPAPCGGRGQRRPIRGTAPGFRSLGAPAGLSRQSGREAARLALSLGLPPQTPAGALVEAIAAAHNRPREVPTGPCKECVQLGEDVDLTRLPAPLLHGGDGGRCLNTSGCRGPHA